MDAQSQNALASRFRALHKPGDPVIMGNVYDAATASIIASLPNARAMATASYAIAAVQGVEDHELTFEQNMAQVAHIAKVAREKNIPLTVDAQDGYDDIAKTIKEIIKLGGVGCNIEDVDNKTGKLRDIDDAVSRIKLGLEAAKEVGVPDFAINARTDILGYDGTIDDAIARGKKFLDAGANTVFVWGGPKMRGLRTEEVKRLAQELNGRLNVILVMTDGFLTVKELKEIGVARISVGPGLWRKAMAAYKDAAEQILG